MTAKELAEKCIDVAKLRKTIYVLGCFGAPMTSANKERYTSNLSYNRQPERTAKIKSASADTFGFDCVCLIKGLLWGWNGSKEVYGGATYNSNKVPDIDADQMIKECSDVSTNFSNVQVGEVVWMPGHIGVYIGEGLAVECTPKWKDGVQITAVQNIGAKAGYNGRTWTKHGKLPYVTYPEIKTEVQTVNVELNVLRKGSEGKQVKALQKLLYAEGYDLGYTPVDGVFGSKTDAAVRAYQKKHALEVDGIVGENTWNKLLKG